MKNLKQSIWLSNLFVAILSIVLIVAVKAFFNTLLLEQQMQLKHIERLAVLQDFTDQTKLEKKIDINKFSYIKISNDRLTSPIIYNNQAHNILHKILPIKSSFEYSITTHQTIEYLAKNQSIYHLYQLLIFITIGALFLASIVYNIIYFNLFKRTESLVVDEIIYGDRIKSPLQKVTEQIKQLKSLNSAQLKLKEDEVDQLLNKANTDFLTGLNNRHLFRDHLDKLLNKQYVDHAVLSIISIYELAIINKSRGFQQGDHYVASVANIIKDVSRKFKGASLFRISGSDFAVIAENMKVEEINKFGKELKLKFDQYQQLNDLESVAFNGITTISPNQLPEQILARADIALAKAQTSGANAFIFEAEIEGQEFQIGEQHWHGVINKIMEKQSFNFLQQPIKAIHRNMKGYQEIFTRFIGDNDNIIPTRTIFSMAQRTDTLIQLEQLIIQKIIDHSHNNFNDNMCWGINISSIASQDKAFVIWLERLLMRKPDIAKLLVFEMEEKLLNDSLISSKRFFDMLKRTGSRSAICGFGKGICSFRLFKELKPDYIKIDASLIADIEDDNGTQHFIRMIIDVAHRMECQVIAEGIEKIEQKRFLERLFIDGIQGYLIARPMPL